MLREIDWGFSRPRRDASASGLLEQAGWLGATVALAAGIGMTVARGNLKPALVPVGALFATLVARVPVAGYIAILWSVGTAVEMNALPQLGLSSLQFFPAEIVLGVAIGCLVLLPGDVRRFVAAIATSRESLVTAAFLTAVIAGVWVGMENGASVHTALLDARDMLFYAAFWPALAALARGRRTAFVLIGAGVVVVVGLQVVQELVGAATQVFLINPADISSSLTHEGTGFLRVRPPGLTTVYIASGFALAYCLWGPTRHRLLGRGMAAVTLTGIVLSLNRNMLLGLAFGLCVAALIAPHRHRFVILAATLTLALGALVLAAQGSGLASNAVAERFASVTNYSKLRTQTLDDRYYENGIALQRIGAHPIAGLGWGPPYGAVLQSWDAGFVINAPRSFMHEQYLWIWMRAGLLGLVTLIAMLFLGLWNGARWFRARDPANDAWLGAGVVISVVAMAASSNVAIYLTPPDSIVPLVGVLALAATMRRELDRR